MRQDAIIVKICHSRPVVSYLLYDDFDNDPHPALFWSMRVDLDADGSQVVTAHYYGNRESPPILHRKELFLRLYENPFKIGTRNGWNKVLADKGVRIEGHEVCAV
jgi:hypothetical protein